jgi:hypothetical protein
MNKLSLDALKERAEAVATEDLLSTISGGTENSCHPCEQCQETYVQTKGSHQPLATWLIHVIFH